MKKLFIALTDYQLINFINLKTTIFKDESVDLIINKNKESKFELAERLDQLKIFDNVFLFSKHKSHFRQHIKSLINRDACFNSCNETIAQSLIEDVSFYYEKILKVFKREYSINASVWKNRCIDFSEYDHVIGIKTERVVSDCIELVKRSNNGQCRFSIIDEGLASYLNIYIENDEDVDSAFLYNPQMAQYDKKITIIPIPKIDKNNMEFIQKLNYVFGMKEVTVCLNDKIIFFGQAWEPMPEYLKNLKGIKKMLFRNAYKKHLFESTRHEFEMELFRVLVENSPKGSVFVKMHPRASSSVIREYKKYGCQFLPNLDLPWELYGVNCEINNGLWVSDNSSALFSYEFAFSTNNTNNFLYGYRICHNNIDYNEETINSFFSSYSVNNQNVFIPENREQYINIIKEYCKKRRCISN